MFLISLLFGFFHASVPAWLFAVILLISLVSIVANAKCMSACCNYRSLITWYVAEWVRWDHLHYRTRAAEEKRSEATRKAHMATMDALCQEVWKLKYDLYGTNEVAEKELRDLCRWTGQSCEPPTPLEGARELLVEASVLGQVILAIYWDLLAGNIIADTAVFQQLVASLKCRVSSWHEQRQFLLQPAGALTTFCEATSYRIKREALNSWNDVVAYALESSPRFLMPFYQESLKKYEVERKRAIRLLVEKGIDAQEEAVEHLCVSMRHWGFWHALRLAMTEERDSTLVERGHVQFQLDVEEGVDQALAELKQAIDLSSIGRSA